MVATQKMFDCMKITSHLSGDASTAKAVPAAYLDMRDYGNVAIIAAAAALTGAGITALSLVASAAAAGTSKATVKSHAVGTAPDAAGDMIVLEASAAEIAAAGTDMRYISAWVDCANAADNIVVTIIRCNPRFPQNALTADVIA